MHTIFKFLFICALMTISEARSACDACYYENEFSIEQIKYLLDDDPKYATNDYDDSSWPLFTVNELLDLNGVFWIRGFLQVNQNELKVKLPHELELRMLASYEIYADGKLIGVSGKVGGTRAEEIPGPYFNKFPLPLSLIETGQMQLAIRISNEYRIMKDQFYIDPFNRLAYNGVFQEFRIYPAKINNRFHESSDWLAVMLMVVPPIIGIYFMFIFWGRRDQKHHLIFSLLNFSIFAVVMVDSAAGFIYSYQWYALRWWLSAITTLSTILLFSLFFLYRFKLPYKLSWLVVLFTFSILCSIYAPLDLPMGRILLILTMMFILLIHAEAFRKGQRGIIGTALFLVAFIIGLLIGPGHFILFFIVFILMILWQLTMEINQQQKEHFESLLYANQLEASLLRKNMQPHFLMNSLTSLIELVETDAQKGAEFIEALGDEFRLLTQVSNKSQITLDKEIQLCRYHLTIMGYRNKQSYEMNIKDMEITKLIPPAIFHTLVENAITHNNFTKSVVTFKLEQRKTESGRHYVFTTPYEPPSGMHRKTHVSTGNGTKYIRSQLQRSYPENWQFDSVQNENSWETHVRIS